jgi:transcriptional regulator with XRE-family HTH domain
MRFDGQALLRAREANGLTQEQLAAASGSTFSTISRLERGLTEPTLTTITKIAKALDVPVATLLADEKDGAAA